MNSMYLIERILNDHMGKVMRTRHLVASLLFFIVIHGSALSAQELALQSVDFSVLPGDQVQVELTFNGPAFEPNAFQTENPARIALDFPGVSNQLERKNIPVNVGITTAINVVGTGDRTRVVINLVSMAPYETRVEGNAVFVSLQKSSAPATKAAGSKAPSRVLLPKQSIENVDFRRGPQGEGRILVSLSNPNTVVDMQERGGKVVISFLNTRLPERLAKRLDVTDFATPIRSIESTMEGSRARITVTPQSRNYDYLSYQTAQLLTLEFRPLTKAQKEAQQKKEFRYTGQRLSLNFQDIAVRSVLQILADFTDLNIVASDSVKGNVTLRLNDVPWDQAMDLILKSKGLAMRQEGNIVRVAPAAEINKQEKEELEALVVKEELEPLRTEIIQVNYAQAADIQGILQGFQESDSGSGGGAGDETGFFAGSAPISAQGGPVNTGSILSKRGTVNIDPRTNVLIVKDTARNLDGVRRLVSQLDKPVRQVLIESRIVVANNDFAKELGVRLAAEVRDNDPAATPVDGDTGFIAGGVASPGGFIVDLPAVLAAGTGGAFGLSLFKIGDYLLNLELSALQNEGRGEILSNPRLITSDQTKAKIEQGVEIAFTSSTDNQVNTQFKKAVLKLEVTPHITPDDTVIMDLIITKDAPRNVGIGEGAIDKREIETTVMVDNGETIVLGGIFENTKLNTESKVPFFGDLPGIGALFRTRSNTDDKTELLIFITPKILKDRGLGS